MTALYRIARALVGVFARLLFRVEYEGLQNVPDRRGGYILAGNHSSYLDPVVLAIGVSPMIHFMAKEELVSRRWAAWLFSKLGVVPVSRGTGDMGAVERCAQLTREGGVLGIFPEGTRYSSGAPEGPNRAWRSSPK
jgi:1-acyl-sn-glycerol-3-phosphate acyltransferase